MSQFARPTLTARRSFTTPKSKCLSTTTTTTRSVPIRDSHFRQTSSLSNLWRHRVAWRHRRHLQPRKTSPTCCLASQNQVKRWRLRGRRCCFTTLPITWTWPDLRTKIRNTRSKPVSAATTAATTTAAAAASGRCCQSSPKHSSNRRSQLSRQSKLPSPSQFQSQTFPFRRQQFLPWVKYLMENKIKNFFI